MQILNQHSEEQYLELETHFFNLFNSVASLLVITEGENLENDDLKISHFNALTKRINEIVGNFDKIKKGVEKVMFKGEKVIHNSTQPLSIDLDENETKMVYECIEHFIHMYTVVDDAEPYKNLLNKLGSKYESK